jgi:transposase-like protein
MSGLQQAMTRRKYSHFSEKEKRLIIEDYLQSGLSKKEIWKKYTGQSADHGLILYWMYKYGYQDSCQTIVTFVPKNIPMKEEAVSNLAHLQMQNRLLELEKQLQESEKKCIAYQRMIELAEREFAISIKKKFNTKLSKK